MPRSVFVTAIWAFTTLAPAGSRTVPLMEAVSCACTNVPDNNANAAIAIPYGRRFLMSSSFADSTRSRCRQIPKSGEMPLLKRINTASGV
jgi:hypothetical protein